MDKLFIHDLKIETIIGCLAWERKVRQTVIFDFEIDYDCKAAAVSDELNDALDYSGFAKTVSEFAANSKFKLIETLAEQTAALIMQRFKLNKVYLKLTKPGAIPNARAVAVSIERSPDAGSPDAAQRNPGK